MSLNNETSEDGELGENFVDLATRIERLPLDKKVAIADKYNCKQEFAGLIYFLENNLGINGELVLTDLKYELSRLEKIDRKIPEIETYLHRFTLEEGKWITFLRDSFPKKIHEEAKKIQPMFSKIGKVKGSDLLTLSTQIMMERQYIAANTIIPVIEKWKEEHKGSTDLDAGIRILAGYKKQPVDENLYQLMELAREKISEQINILGDVLSGAEQSNWIIRSLIECEIIYEDLNQPLEEASYKGIADIILWVAANDIAKKIGDFSETQDMAKMIMRFQLESNIGLSKASPIATLEYELLSLSYKDDFVKKKLAEEMILKAWKESRIGNSPVEIGREILPMLIDYSNAPMEFLTKVTPHFDFVIENYNYDKMRLNRALERIKIKGKESTEEEKLEAVILDYLTQFTINYIAGKVKPNIMDLEIPDTKDQLDLLAEEKEIVDFIDAALRRGIRSKNKTNAKKVVQDQIASMYQRGINFVKDEVTVGEFILYGIFNNHDIEITRAEARELINKHFRRMMVSAGRSTKKRIDSAVQMAIKIELEEKIIDKEMD